MGGDRTTTLIYGQHTRTTKPNCHGSHTQSERATRIYARNTYNQQDKQASSSQQTRCFCLREGSYIFFKDASQECVRHGPE